MPETTMLANADRRISEAWQQPLDRLRASAGHDPVLTGVLILRQALIDTTSQMTSCQQNLHRLTKPEHNPDRKDIEKLSTLTGQLLTLRAQAESHLYALTTILNAHPRGYLAELHLLRTHHLTNTPPAAPTPQPGPDH